MKTKLALIALAAAGLSGCTVVVPSYSPYEVWVPPTYPQVTAWEYARLNGCIPRGPAVIPYQMPQDPAVAAAEARAAAAEAAVDRQRAIDDAEARRLDAEAELDYLRRTRK